MKQKNLTLNVILISSLFSSISIFADVACNNDCDCGKAKPKPKVEASLFNRSKKKESKKSKKAKKNKNKNEEKLLAAESSLSRSNENPETSNNDTATLDNIATEVETNCEDSTLSKKANPESDVSITYGVYDKEEREFIQKSLENLNFDDRFNSSTAPAEVEAISNDAPYRLLISKDPNGWNLELDDGSVWRAIGSSDADSIKKWRSNDPLVIQPTLFPSLSGGRFILYNQRLNTYAISEISAGPILNTATNVRISYIDIYTGVVDLIDGKGRSCAYRLDFSDKNLFKTWKVGDSIILGSNENCYSGWFSRAPFILINIECNNFVKASME